MELPVDGRDTLTRRQKRFAGEFCRVASLHEPGEAPSLLQLCAMNSFTFIYPINTQLLKAARGLEIIRTHLRGVCILMVEADNKKRKQIKGVTSEFNIAMRDRKEGEVIGVTHTVCTVQAHKAPSLEIHILQSPY